MTAPVLSYSLAKKRGDVNTQVVPFDTESTFDLQFSNGIRDDIERVSKDLMSKLNMTTTILREDNLIKNS
jgi:hypothetical protein